MAEIVFMHYDKNGAREVARHDTGVMIAELEAVTAAQKFIDWANQNPDATTQEQLRRFIELPELAQERLGEVIESEAKARGLI